MNNREGGMLPRTAAAPAPADYCLITGRVVRRLNRKVAFYRLYDRFVPWGIAGCYVALYGFFEWLGRV